MSTINIATTSIVGIVAEIYFLWIFYLAVMTLKRARDAGTISKTALLLGYPVLLVGYLLDMVVNVTVLSLLTLDLPREATVSQHLRRLSGSGKPFQKSIANWIAVNLLDAFDPSGSHL